MIEILTWWLYIWNFIEHERAWKSSPDSSGYVIEAVI